MQILPESEKVFPDARLETRYGRIIEKLEGRPADSFPDIMETATELEGLYRFLNNDRVSAGLLIARAAEDSLLRCAAHEEVIVPHDTTEFGFSTMREGLGRITDAGRGCFGHFSIAVTADLGKEALGVVGLDAFTRHGPSKRKAGRHSERREEDERESARWWASIEHCENLLSAVTSPIHVMDREADSYLLFAKLKRHQFRFVSRIRSNRRIQSTEERGKLFGFMAKMEATFTREVTLSAREGPNSRVAHPPRDVRPAILEIAAGSVTLRRPVNPEVSDELMPKTLTFNVVHVREIQTPAGATPVDWKLITEEPVETREQIEKIVDVYRARWRIEEFFKALKTGCSVEKRQLESAAALLNAIALFAPIAINLLRLRAFSREDEERPASEVLRPLQTRLLELYKNTRLVPNATVKQAMLCIARLGGHLKQNGEPGWQVLGRGYEKLLLMELGAVLASAQEK